MGSALGQALNASGYKRLDAIFRHWSRSVTSLWCVGDVSSLVLVKQKSSVVSG